MLPLSFNSFRDQAPIPVRKGWNPAIFQMLARRAEGLALSEQDRLWFEAHKNVHWYWTGPDSSPSAYAGFGRGIDLQGIVHEWGGDLRALQTILASIAQENKAKSDPPSDPPSDPMILGSPEGLSKLGFSAGEIPVEYLCMAKVLDPAKLVQAYRPNTPCSFSRSGGTWNIDIAQRPITGLNDSELARVLFGPDRFEEFAGILPLPLWIWGLDAA
jgi:hypothetical protein